jgi:hypothetical protein
MVFASLVVVSIAMRARAPPAGLTFRFGQPADVLPIATTLLKEKMNPLAIDHSRFIVCESVSTGERVGFGQIRQLSASKAPDPTKFDARPGSRTLQADLDDDAWEDFESLGPVPHGLDSLPWSPSYRALSDRAVLQRARRRARLEQVAAERSRCGSSPPCTWTPAGAGVAWVAHSCASCSDGTRSAATLSATCICLPSIRSPRGTRDTALRSWTRPSVCRRRWPSRWVRARRSPSC